VFAAPIPSVSRRRSLLFRGAGSFPLRGDRIPLAILSDVFVAFAGSPMLEIENVDLGMLGSALADQDYDNRYTFDPVSGESLIWNDAIDEQPDEDALFIEALPSWVWYRDMADFTAGLSDQRIAERLERAMQGRGAFRRFRGELYGRHEHLVAVWNAFRDNRTERRAVEWLRDNQQITEEAADRYLAAHPDPEIP
jgi:hypothetical protein